MEDKEKPSRHTQRQRTVRKCRRAARENNYEEVLKQFMELCLMEIEGNEVLTNKISPKIIIDIIHAQLLLKKAQKDLGEVGEDADFRAFQDRLKVMKGGK